MVVAIAWAIFFVNGSYGATTPLNYENFHATTFETEATCLVAAEMVKERYAVPDRITCLPVYFKEN